MAELQSCSGVLKRHPSSIAAVEHRAPTLSEQPVSDFRREKEDTATSLQSNMFHMEGERYSFQFEQVLSPRPLFKRARWEEPHTDIASSRHEAGTYCRLQTVNVGSFGSHSPKCPPQAHSAAALNDHVSPIMPGQFGVSMEQLPLPSSQQSPLAVSYIPSNSRFVLPKSGSAFSATQNLATDQKPISGINVSDVLAELEKERKKNAELLGRLSSLEARLEERERSTEGGAHIAEAILPNGSKRTRFRTMEKTGEIDEADTSKLQDREIGIKQEDGLQALGTDLRDGCSGPYSVVTWMNREEVQLSDLERPNIKDANSDVEDSTETDESDDDDESSSDDDDEDDDEETQIKEYRMSSVRKHGERETTIQDQFMGSGDGMGSDCRIMDVKEQQSGSVISNLGVDGDHCEGIESDTRRTKRKSKNRRDGRNFKAMESHHFGKRGSSCELVPYRFSGMISSYRNAPKIAFCPQEVKRIMESGVLALKNAQSHTMRKIIVFASLGIRHGCEDLYELEFNHFSIMRRGEPYVSPNDPGEHVVYDHPNVRRRIFYPNRKNSILCPVHILDEERVMRPTGPSCPSCLFLCIKYGGRTRNLPQNEYVRQRMGRNKLKSFGPLMCQMALLAHIRTGSFFFKALGITLLFMAGFSNELVRKETKYRNLDLLQKYYRSDEDAKGDLLFHPYPTFYPQALMATQAVQTKVSASGSKPAGKKQAPPLLSKPSGPQTAAPFYLLPTAHPLSAPPFGVAAFPSILGPMGSPLPPSFPPTAALTCTAGNATVTSGATAATTNVFSVPATLPPLPPPPYGAFHPFPVQRVPTAGFPPVPVWPPHGPFPSHPYGYQAFPHTTQYGSHTSPSYYGQPFPSFPPAVMKGSDNNNNGQEQSDSDSENTSSGDDQKSDKDISSDSKNV